MTTNVTITAKYWYLNNLLSYFVKHNALVFGIDLRSFGEVDHAPLPFFLSQHCTVERMRVCPDSIRKSINPHRLSPNETFSRIEYLRFISVCYTCTCTPWCWSHLAAKHIVCSLISLFYARRTPTRRMTAYASRVRLFLNTVLLTCDSDRKNVRKPVNFVLVVPSFANRT